MRSQVLAQVTLKMELANNDSECDDETLPSDIGSDSGEIECGDSRFGAEYKTQRAKINNLIKDVNAKLKGGA